MDTTNPLLNTSSYLPRKQKDKKIDEKPENAYLDAFLAALPNDCSTVSMGIFIFKIEISNSDYYTAKKVLIEKGFITEERRNYLPPSLRLTPLGSHFLARGGFVYEQKVKARSLKMKRLARAALIISMIALIASVVAFVIAICNA
jgi:hypothetical protein